MLETYDYRNQPHAYMTEGKYKETLKLHLRTYKDMREGNANLCLMYLYKWLYHVLGSGH